MPVVRDYINEEKQQIYWSAYLNAMTAAVATKENASEARRIAYAIAVLEINQAVAVYRWLGDFAFAIAINGYVSTVNSYYKTLGIKEKV